MTMMEPQLFGKYILLEKLAAGGMGEVHLAKAGSAGIERYFAIKRILTQHEGSEEFIEALFEEAKIAISLVHPNIAQVFEFGELNGTFFLAMEYIEGMSMVSLIRASTTSGKRMAHTAAISILIQLCRALDYAHNKRDSSGNPFGIIHRDVSPQNVLVDTNGTAKLIDFGVAKAAGRRQLTEVGVIKGKLAYMSPEQATGRPLDRRSDIWAIGIMLYEALTLDRMFSGDTQLELLAKVQNPQLPSFDRIMDGHAPESLIMALQRSLEPNRDKRYSQASEMEKDLTRALHQIDPGYTNQGLGQLIQAVDLKQQDRSERFKIYADIHTENVHPTAMGASLNTKIPANTTHGRGSFFGKHHLSGHFSPQQLGLAALVAAILGLTGWLLLRPDAVSDATVPMAPAADVPTTTSQQNSQAPLDDPQKNTPKRQISLDSKPRHGEVWVNDMMRGTTPLILRDIETLVPTRLRIEKSGYVTYQQIIKPGTNQTLRIKARLKRIPKNNKRMANHALTRAEVPQEPPATPSPKIHQAKKPAMGCVSIVVEPWAYVLIDGKRKGQTPMKCLSLSAGDQKLTLSNPALGITKVVDISVKANDTVRVFERF